MSRSSLLEQGIVTAERFRAACKEKGTIIGVAKALKINRITVRRMACKLGIDFKHEAGKPKGAQTRKYSTIVKWIRRHPDVKLPRSIKRISLLTGCGADAVKMYLYRQRKHARDAIRSLPDLRRVNARFKTPDGHTVPFKYIDWYEILFDPWLLLFKVRLKVKMSGRIHVFRLKNLKAIVCSDQSASKSTQETPDTGPLDSHILRPL
jgi:hypothetical protein